MSKARELSEKYYPLPMEVEDMLKAYAAEVERLKETIQGLQKILEYSPTAELKAENTRLRSALEKYADRRNWQKTFICFDKWILSCDGETLAQQTLQGGVQSACKWQLDQDHEISTWNTSCGEAFGFSGCTPKEVGCIYCTHCGKSIEFVEQEGGEGCQ